MIGYLYAVVLRLIPAWRAHGDHRAGRRESTMDTAVVTLQTTSTVRVSRSPLLLAAVWGEVA